jgi:hypothetical protein
MKELIAFCGLACHTCPAFLATQSDDDAKRAEVAEQWSKEYHADIKTEDVNCNGCTSAGGPYFNYCNICEIRKCGKEKGIVSCGFCSEYSCEKLAQIFKNVPDAKKRLDNIHNNL